MSSSTESGYDPLLPFFLGESRHYINKLCNEVQSLRLEPESQRQSIMSTNSNEDVTHGQEKSHSVPKLQHLTSVTSNHSDDATTQIPSEGKLTPMQEPKPTTNFRDAFKRYQRYPSSWPKGGSYPSAWALASAGFTYDSTGCVQCAFCGCKLNITGTPFCKEVESIAYKTREAVNFLQYFYPYQNRRVVSNENMMLRHFHLMMKENVRCPFVLSFMQEFRGERIENTPFPMYNETATPPPVLPTPPVSKPLLGIDTQSQLSDFVVFVKSKFNHPLPVGNLVDRFNGEGFAFRNEDERIVCTFCGHQLDPERLRNQDREEASKKLKDLVNRPFFHPIDSKCDFFQQIRRMLEDISRVELTEEEKKLLPNYQHSDPLMELVQDRLRKCRLMRAESEETVVTNPTAEEEQSPLYGNSEIPLDESLSTHNFDDDFERPD